MRKLIAGLLVAAPLAAAAAELPIFDAHMHYSHDAWDVLPPKEVIAILKKAGVRRALVSSSGDDGQQRLKSEAPELIVTELRRTAPAATPARGSATTRCRPILRSG